jgi:hypothetical protein
MVLIPKDEGWLLRLRTKQGVIELPLRGTDLEAALIEAEQLYVDAYVVTTGKARCQQCIHWLFVEGMCGLGFPEGKRSGGKHAKDCAAFWLDSNA